MEIPAQCPNIKQSAGVHNAPYQHEYLQTGELGFLLHAPGPSGTVAVSPSPGSILGVQNNTSNQGTKQTLTGPPYHFDSYADVIEKSPSMTPSAYSFSQPVPKFTEWNGMIHPILSPDPLSIPPSIIDTYNYSNLGQDTANQCGALGGQQDGTFGDLTSSGLVNEHLWPAYQYSNFMPSESQFESLSNGEFFRGCMFDVQPVSQYSPGVPSVPISGAFMSKIGPQIHISLDEEGSPLQSGPRRNLERRQTRINDSLSSRSSCQFPDSLLYVSNSSNAEKRPYQSIVNEVENSELIVTTEKKSKQPRLMAKPASTSDITRITNNNNTSKKTKKDSRHRGQMSDDKRKQTATIRKMMACAACSVSHLACSDGDPCDRCTKTISSPSSEILCNRGKLPLLHFEVLSPHFLHGRLSPMAFDMVADHLEYINNDVEIFMSTGGDYPPISLWACEYIPKRSKKSSSNSLNDIKTFANLPSLNYGVPRRNVYQLRLRILEHIQAISNRSTVIGKQELLTTKVLNAIFHFQQTDAIAGQNELLANAIMLNRLHYVLGRSIIFKRGKGPETVRKLQNVAMHLPTPPQMTAEVLASQLKGTMTGVLDDKTRQFLHQYELELKSKNSETWLLCLLTHLILCLSAELIQIQVNGFVAFRISLDDCNPEEIRRGGAEICQRIENKVLTHCWQLLGGKPGDRLKKQNPFVDEMEFKGASEAEQSVISKLRQIIMDHKREIMNEAPIPLCGGYSTTPEDVANFQNYNTGRLLSKYLRGIQRGGKVE